MAPVKSECAAVLCCPFREIRKVMKTIALFRTIAGVIRGLKALKVMTINSSLGTTHEFVCISFRTGNLNCFWVK